MKPDPVAGPLPGHDFSFAHIIEHANDVVVVTDAATGGIVYVNPAFTALTGFTRSQAMGLSPGRLLQGPGTDGATVQRIRHAVERLQAIRTEILNYDTQGREYWLDINIVPLPNAQGHVTHFAAVERDITRERLARDELKKLVGTDPLTGVANRRRFQATLQHEWQRAERDARPLAFIAFDIDHFKRINDGHGHDAGDQVLRAVASRCAGALRPGDLLARLGGEEFCVLLPQADLHHAVQVAERLRHEVANNPVRVDGVAIHVSASFGVAVRQADDHADDAAGAQQATMARADRLMYAAKAAGRNRVHSTDTPPQLPPGPSHPPERMATAP